MSAVSLAAFRIARPRVARSKRKSSSYSVIAVGQCRVLNMESNEIQRTENSRASTESAWNSEGMGVAETKKAERRDATARVVVNFIFYVYAWVVIWIIE